MGEKVTIFELLAAIAPLAIALIGGWIHMKVTVGTLKTKLEFIQKELNEEKEGNKQNFEKLSSKIDSLFGKIGEVRELILNTKKS